MQISNDPERAHAYDRVLLRDTLERLRSCAEFDLNKKANQQWHFLLGLTREEIEKVNRLSAELPTKSVQGIADYFGLTDQEIYARKIDFREISIRHSKQLELPQPYRVGAFGRRRGTMSSLDYIEKRSGWKVRRDVFRKFGLTEAMFVNPMDQINIRLMTEVAAYMETNFFYQERDLFEMGANLSELDRCGPVAQTLGQYRTPAALFERFFGDLMKFFELNCTYSIITLDEEHCVFEVRSRSDVAEALRVRHLGGSELCKARVGMYACMTAHIGLECAHGRETECVHNGAPACRYELRYSNLRAVTKPLS